MTPVIRTLQCSKTGKRVYPNAEAAHRRMSNHMMSSSPGVNPPIRAYQCPHCGFVHLTSKPLTPAAR